MTINTPVSLYGFFLDEIVRIQLEDSLESYVGKIVYLGDVFEEFPFEVFCLNSEKYIPVTQNEIFKIKKPKENKHNWENILV